VNKEDKNYLAHMILTLVSTIISVFSGLAVVEYHELNFIYGLVLAIVLSVSIYGFGIFLIGKEE